MAATAAVWLAAPDETVSFVEAEDFDRHPLTVKLGGLPAWLLDPTDSPNPDPICSLCKAPMSLVVQCHAPVVDTEARVLYVFGCTSGKCQSSFIAFRAQSVYENDPYAADDPETTKTATSAAECFSNKADRMGPPPPPTFAGAEFDDFDDDPDSSIPPITTPSQPIRSSCPVPASSAPSNTPHDALPSQIKPLAKRRPPPAPRDRASHGRAFAPICLDVFPEPEGPTRADEAELQSLRQQVKSLTVDGDAGGEEYETGPIDKAFAKFTKRMARHPKQCLRWSLGGTPLAIQAQKLPPLSSLPGAGSPPPCEVCGANRQFELQVLPTAIYYLESYWRRWGETPGASAPPDAALGFGVVSVYTCSEHCDTDGYSTEWVHVQPEV